MNSELIENPTEEQINRIRKRLQEYNSLFWETRDKTNYIIQNAQDGDIKDGIIFSIFGRWLEIQYLWVREAERGKGLGRHILTETENLAKSKGCRKSFLNTFNFQAKPFYEKNGYKVAYVQEGYPIKNTRYFLEKDLRD